MSLTASLAFIDEAANKIVEAIDNSGMEAIQNDALVVIEDHMIDVGQFYAQGDVALVRLAAVPENATEVTGDFPMQVAPGNTKGSRHVWASRNGLRCFEVSGNSELKGHVYVLDKSNTLTHPEHGDHQYPAGFIGHVTYQRAAAEELRRAQD